MRLFHTNERVKIVDYNEMMNGIEGIIIWIEKRPKRPRRYLLRVDLRRYSSWAGRKMEPSDVEQGIPQEIIDTYIDDSRYGFWWVVACEIQAITEEEKEEEQLLTEENYDEFRVDRETESVLASDGKYHDKHYCTCVVEPIVAMQALLTAEQFKGFLIGNALKYHLRAGHKEDAQQDIDKALRYETWLKEYEQEGEITI